MNAFRRRPFAAATMALAIATGCLSVSPAAARQAPFVQKTFASPEDAIQALLAAVKVHDKAALRDIFGPGVHELLTGVEARDKADSQSFAKAMEEGARPVSEGDDTVILEIGGNKWPFPIPLVKADSAWRFDTTAGKEEILNRHIGKDELYAIGVCETYVRTQKQSAGGSRGPGPKPYHGYFFKVLARQGASAPGGKLDYIKDLPEGFALEAYPEHWGRSGVMTFIVDQDGRIYRRDLGKKTSRIAAAMTEYNPDGDWTLEKDRGLTEK